MYFDGAARISGAGASIVLISLEKHMLPYNFVLVERCSNNVAKYSALIIDLQMTLEIEVSFIEIRRQLKKNLKPSPKKIKNKKVELRYDLIPIL